MITKFYDTLPDEAKIIREEVFVKEQGFKNEFDEIDTHCYHAVVFDNDTPIAVGRFFTDDNNNYHIGRIAVIKAYRGHNIGNLLMNECEKQIIKLGGKSISLSAQCQARGFYEKCGYKQVGDIYYDEHCPHIAMTKEL
jgi:predicted GNAT family N-acyltransferase